MTSNSERSDEPGSRSAAPPPEREVRPRRTRKPRYRYCENCGRPVCEVLVISGPTLILIKCGSCKHRQPVRDGD